MGRPMHLRGNPLGQVTAPLPDPRRPGLSVALVACPCGRDYVLTSEEARRLAGMERPACPSCAAWVAECTELFGETA